jgi:hypothetical protein
MSNLKVILSQSVVNEMHKLSLQYPNSGTINSIVNSVNTIDYSISTSHYNYSSINQFGSTIVVGFPDGSTENYYGTSINPYVSSGTTSANEITFTDPSVATIGEAGDFSYSYSKTASGYSFYSTGGTLTSWSATTSLPSSSPDYNPDVGNVSIQLQGNVTSDATHNFSGTLTSITETADKYLSSASIQGAFQISGNSISIGANLSSSTVTGSLTSLTEKYYDGSIATFAGQGSSINISNNQNIGLAILNNTLQGNNTVDVELPPTLYSPVNVALGDGNNSVTLKGGGGNLSTTLGNGNNTIYLLDGNHSVTAGTGIDTVVLAGNAQNYSITKTTSGYTVSDTTGLNGPDTLTNVDRIKFADGSGLALDLGNGGHARQVAEILGAVFGPASIQAHPDYVGIGLNALDNGMSVSQLSALALQTAGATSNTAIVDLLYTNILGVAPTAAQAAPFIAMLKNGMSAGALTAAAEASSINDIHINLIGFQKTGIHYT